MVRIGRHESLMTFQEEWNPCAPGGGPLPPLCVSCGPEKLELIVLKERLAEGEEYVKELEKLRA